MPTEVETAYREAQAEAEAAHLRMVEAKRAFDAELNEKLKERQLRGYQRAQESSLFAENPTHDVRPYILPFGRGYAKFNPLKDGPIHEFGQKWLSNMTALICRRLDEKRTRPSRLIWTSGVNLPDRDKIGQKFTARHDQTGARLGEYEIVGIVQYDIDGNVWRTAGDVPDVKFTQATYK